MSTSDADSPPEPDPDPAYTPNLVESCTVPAESCTIHAHHPFRNIVYIDVETPKGTVDTQIRVHEVDLHGADISDLDRALHLEDVEITLNARQTRATISQR